MNSKRIAVVYQSRNGNTKAVAERIAYNFDVEAVSINEKLEGDVDHLFIGCGAYMHDMDKNLRNYINSLPDGQIKKVTPFSTSGNDKVVNKKIAEAFESRGIEVTRENLVIRFLLKGHAILLKKGGKLSNSQINEIDTFCKSCEPLLSVYGDALE